MEAERKEKWQFTINGYKMEIGIPERENKVPPGWMDTGESEKVICVGCLCKSNDINWNYRRKVFSFSFLFIAQPYPHPAEYVHHRL